MQRDQGSLWSLSDDVAHSHWRMTAHTPSRQCHECVEYSHLKREASLDRGLSWAVLCRCCFCIVYFLPFVKKIKEIRLFILCFFISESKQRYYQLQRTLIKYLILCPMVQPQRIWRRLKTFDRKWWDDFSPFQRDHLIDQLRVGFEPAESESWVIDSGSLNCGQQQASSLAQITRNKWKLIGLCRTGSDNHWLRKLEDFCVCARMTGQPLFHFCTLVHEALLLPPTINSESRETSVSDLESFD
jgi:hypothetical protein